MAGRGRGRGKPSLSINTEQLGFAKGEALPPPVLQPPPRYPILEYKPIPFTITNEMSYLLELKREFAEYMRESPNNILPLTVKKDIERYSDRYQDLITDKSSYETRYDWSRMPVELKPTKKRKGQKITKPEKKQKNVDVETKLKELEKKENTQQSDAEEEGKEEEEVEEKEEEQVEEEEEEVDEEMDEGTDYVNNYFDNGEAYDEEEDNLDDGPIY